MRWRKQTRKPTSPNFLFSLPPFFEDDTVVPTIVVAPSGRDDTAQLQAAVNRIAAVLGGTLRLTGGDFVGRGTIYLDPRYSEDSRQPKRKLYTSPDRKAEYWKRKEFLKSVCNARMILDTGTRIGKKYR